METTENKKNIVKHFHSTEKATVDNYPYGYLKTSATFGMEFKPKKGFRTVFQTVNPKTGRINAPKYSTYNDLMLMVQYDNGYINYVGQSLNGAKEINKACLFINEHFDLFTPAMIEHFYSTIFSMLRVETVAICQYCGADLDKVKKVIEPVIKLAVSGIKNGGNIFNQIKIDIEALEACKIPDFNPFRIVQYEDVTKNHLNNPVVTQISDHDKRQGHTVESVQMEENIKALNRDESNPN